MQNNYQITCNKKIPNSNVYIIQQSKIIENTTHKMIVLYMYITTK